MALFYVVIFLAVTAIPAIGFLGSLHALIRDTARERASVAAFHAADGGVALARARLARDPAWRGGPVEVGAGRAEVRVEPVSGDPAARLVLSRGVVPSSDAPGATIERRVRAMVRLGAPGALPAVVAWGEE